MVGNSHGAVSPLFRCLDSYIGRNKRIHCRHIGVQMQLNTLNRSIVCAFYSLYNGNIRGKERKVLVDLAATRFVLGVAVNCHRNAVLDKRSKLLCRIDFHIASYFDRCISVCNRIRGVHLIARACWLLSKAKYLTYNYSLKRLCKLTQCGRRYLKSIAYTIIGRGKIKLHISRAIYTVLKMSLVFFAVN